MCEPLTIAGLALSAGSMLANNAAQSKIDKARQGAMEAERIRQKGYQKEASLLNDGSRDRYEDYSGQQEKKAAELSDYFQSDTNTSAGAPTETMPGVSSNIVVQEQAKQKAKADAFGAQQSAALGNLRGFGDVLGDISRLQGRDAAQVGTIGGFMRGSSGVLPYELEAANNKGGGMKLFGDILGGLGSVSTSAGLSNGGLGVFGAAAPKVSKAAPVASHLDMGPFLPSTPWRNIPWGA